MFSIRLAATARMVKLTRELYRELCRPFAGGVAGGTAEQVLDNVFDHVGAHGQDGQTCSRTSSQTLSAVRRWRGGRYGRAGSRQRSRPSWRGRPRMAKLARELCRRLCRPFAAGVAGGYGRAGSRQCSRSCWWGRPRPSNLVENFVVNFVGRGRYSWSLQIRGNPPGSPIRRPPAPTDPFGQASSPHRRTHPPARQAA